MCTIGVNAIRSEIVQKDKQERRRREIRDAAYRVLAGKGYKGSSMLAVAREAKASNETLYAWYGSKEGLFETLVEENASRVAEALARALDANRNVERTLLQVGTLLLELVTSERAIALNRAAATDATDTGELGRSLARAGRESVVPLLVRVFEQARDAGTLAFEDDDRIVEVYIGLLIGDTQIRRTTGALAELSAAEIDRRAARALTLLSRLFAP